MNNTMDDALNSTNRTDSQDFSISTGTNNNSLLTLNPEYVLWTLNNIKAADYTPAIIFLLVLIPIATIGNGLVVYIFHFRFQTTTANIFIKWLAVFDLVCATCSMPFEIIDMRFPMMSGLPVLCRLIRFLLYFSSTASALTLVCIAYDRYSHVCHPLKIFSNRKAMRIIVLVFFLAFILTWPALVLYNQENRNTTIPGVMGSDCVVIDSLYITVFFFVLMAAFISSLTFIIVTYTRLLLVLMRRNKATFGGDSISSETLRFAGSSLLTAEDAKQMMKTISTISSVRPFSDQTIEIANYSTNTIKNANMDNEKPFDPNSTTDQWNLGVTQGVAPTTFEFDDGRETNNIRNQLTGAKESKNEEAGLHGKERDPSSPLDTARKTSDREARKKANYNKRTTERNTSKDKNTRKALRTLQSDGQTAGKQVRLGTTTSVFVVVSAAYILSYVPFLTAELLSKLDVIYVRYMSGIELQVYAIADNSAFISNAVNPFIYAAFYPKVRQEVLALFKPYNKK